MFFNVYVSKIYKIKYQVFRDVKKFGNLSQNTIYGLNELANSTVYV